MLFGQRSDRILIGIYQILTNVDQVYEVELPPDVQYVIYQMRVCFSVGLADSTALLTCIERQMLQQRVRLLHRRHHCRAATMRVCALAVVWTIVKFVVLSLRLTL